MGLLVLTSQRLNREVFYCSAADQLKSCERTIMAALCVNLLTVNMFLSAFFLPGDLADCPDKSKLFITAPKKMEALSGSCLHIPCNFTAEPGEEKFDSTRPTFGVWFKNYVTFAKGQDNAVYSSSGTDNKYPMNIIGNLRQKNCSTLFSNLTTSHTDTYFFRVENWPYRATASCDNLQITVKDSPWSPSIHISAGDLKEKQSVSITCSALTPCPHSPPQLTWNLHPDSHSETEENTDGTFTTKLQQNITLSHTHDGYNISCSATYPVNGGRNKTAETQQTLSVSYAPKDTSASISPSGLLSAGIWVNLTCSSRAKPPISSFTWFKNTKDGPKKVHEGHMYSLEMTNMADIEPHYCVATNALGDQTSSWVNFSVSDSFQHTAAVVAVIVVVALVCLALCVWRFKKCQSEPETLSQTAAQLPLQTPAAGTQDEIHYGDISISSRRPGPSSVSVQDSGQQQDTVYAQVKVNSCTQPGDAEELYAQVKK
ncbi:sialic acid-binding Ig-like lectin 7 [Parambassis ranga]|uniref:Sialic acid-binding Ig-like lectin 7 n=1 Tax=Parambassis ranga TaxID=210632 RepID=A0A6P7KI84_9TELE|nr:sialic acid-binding Ig-like lectin 7 [Parambassis ranga]